MAAEGLKINKTAKFITALRKVTPTVMTTCAQTVTKHSSLTYLSALLSLFHE